jgi:ABC-type dipeptide/oligopeptide/nickel transport system permease subunit
LSEPGALGARTVPQVAARRAQGRVVRRFLRHRAGLVGLVFVVLAVATAVFAPAIAPRDPIRADFLNVRQAPSATYRLGTDDLGRDILSRVIWGARASLLAGVISVSIAVGVGVPLGLASGYFRGRLDELIMRLTDALLAFPFLILAIALAAALGPSLQNAMIAIGIVTTPGFIRLTRGQVLAAREEEFVQAARAAGASDPRIMFLHILPNTLAPLLVQASLAIATAIIAESALSFLGLGQQPPAPSWGSMLNTAQSFLERAPWMAIWPGLAIFVTVLSFNLVGDALRDALDPRTQAGR